MKTKDIEAGQQYAYSRSTYMRPARVTVIEVGVMVPGKPRNTVRVRHDEGREVIVNPRTLRCTWHEWVEESHRREDARKRARIRRREEQRQAARRAKALDDVLRLGGHPVAPARIYVPTDDLLAAGFDFVDVEHPTVVTALSDLTSALNGKVAMVDALRLAGISEEV